MIYVRSKKDLAVTLSRLKRFDNPKWKLEQFETDGDSASDAIWSAYLSGSIDNKQVLDLGAGTGVLGLGALLVGASKVCFIDCDEDALNILRENILFLSERYDEDFNSLITIINSTIESLNKSDLPWEPECIIQNPPFGAKGNDHADKRFLEFAFSVSRVVYSFHKSTSDSFVFALSRDHKFEITKKIECKFPLRNTQHYHKSKIKRIDVTLYVFSKLVTTS